MKVFRKIRECILRARTRATHKKMQELAEQYRKADEEKKLIREKSYLYE